MYKVFIDNKSEIYPAQNETELLQHFRDYKLVEAAGGIVEYDGKYLFIKRHGLWDIPKGKLEKNEIPAQGAVREIEEECGLNQPQIFKHLTDTWHTYEHKGKQVIKKTYWYWLKSDEKNINLLPQTEEGITEAAFFSASEFDRIKANTYGSIALVIAALEKEIRTA